MCEVGVGKKGKRGRKGGRGEEVESVGDILLKISFEF